MVHFEKRTKPTTFDLTKQWFYAIGQLQNCSDGYEQANIRVPI